MSRERRLHPRAEVRLPAQLGRGGDAWEEALLFDLSAAGAAVHTHGPLPLQSEVHLRFRFPAGEEGEEIELTLSTLVVRQGPPEQAAQSFSHVAGLHFLDLHGRAFDRVRARIWELVSTEAAAG